VAFSFKIHLGSMKKLLVIDVSNYIYRAFYGIRPLSTKDGIQTNAVFGFIKSIISLVELVNPDTVVFARESKNNHKKNNHVTYKEGRKTPDELKGQFAIIDRFIDLTGLNNITVDGFEADDVIGSIATQYESKYDEIILASNDKDLMMFISDTVKMINSKNEMVGVADVIKKFGISPSQIEDFLVLVGDSADNIKGLKGIGPKTAEKLLKEYRTLDILLENLDKLKNKDVFDQAQIDLNKIMVHIDTTLQIPELIQKELCNTSEMQQFLSQYELFYLKNRFNML
jgi:DNA polymerase-1